MIKFDLTQEGEFRFYTARTMDNCQIGRCRFFKDGYVCVIDMLESGEADVAEGLCRASFDKCLQELCAYGEFRNFDSDVIKGTCFEKIEFDKPFVVTGFFNICCNCNKK